jgi:hypothetical protein
VVLLETAISTQSVQTEDNWGNQVISVWDAVKKRNKWKEDVFQKELERGSRGITVVRSRYQKTSSENTAGWKDSARASDL